MKAHYIAACISALLLAQSNATISIAFTFAAALDADSNAVPDGTLWALVVDNNNDVFAGFGLNESLYDEDQLTPGVADLFFTSGQSFSLGDSVGGGTIFAMGAFNGDSTLSTTGGTVEALAGLTLGQNGLAASQEYAFYWFPDATYTGGPSETIASEVGGLNTTTGDSGLSLGGMIIPADGGDETHGAASTAFSGETSANSFRAVALIPEPSTALMGAFGALALLRRRRVTQA